MKFRKFYVVSLILGSIFCINHGCRSDFGLQVQSKVAVQESDWQLGPFTRPVNQPIISPRQSSVFMCPMRGCEVHWEKSYTFNPGAVVFNDQIYVLYRAEDGSGSGIGDHTSRIGLGVSENGIDFECKPKPVLFPADDIAKPYEWKGGCEDPRVVESPSGQFYMYYTMWNRDNPTNNPPSARIGIASSHDLVNWKKHGPVFKDAYNGQFLDIWHKSAAVVTKVSDGRLKATKINGKYWMYWGESSIHAATSNDLIHWKPVVNDKGELIKLISPRSGKFDSLLTEAGPPAVVTDKGIVLLYNGKNNGDDESIPKGAYAAGQALFDKENPLKVLDRCRDYFLKPEKAFEQSGQYADGTVFVEGLVYFKDNWYLYYGAADSYVGVAVCK
jgi:predicted GH43/DUF377 family glycosyl hydrolase